MKGWERALARFSGLLAVLALLVAATPGRPVLAGPRAAGNDPRFGAVEAYRAAAAADGAGVGYQRISFLWNGLQPNGPEDWNAFYLPDDLVQSELAAGREIVGLLMGPPAWANGTGNGADPPRGLYADVDDPANLWAAYVKRVVGAYRGRIDTWVLWNEPDIFDSSFPLYAWSGSDADFYQLQKTGYLAAKAANPGATVTLPGLTYWWDQEYGREQFFARYLRLAAADPSAPAHNWYFDVAVLHLYNDPALLYTVPRVFRALMAAYGIDRPIWINETNVVPWDDPASPLTRERYRASQDEQASYLVQAFANALAAGAERVGVYKLVDDPGYPPGAEPYGLVTADGQPKPAYAALRVITRYFAGARDAVRSEEGPLVRVQMRTNRGRVTVLWNMSPQAVEVPLAAGPDAVLVTKTGQTYAAGPSVTLAGATANTVPGYPSVYLIGGSPILVVEPAN